MFDATGPPYYAVVHMLEKDIAPGAVPSSIFHLVIPLVPGEDPAFDRVFDRYLEADGK